MFVIHDVYGDHVWTPQIASKICIGQLHQGSIMLKRDVNRCCKVFLGWFLLISGNIVGILVEANCIYIALVFCRTVEFVPYSVYPHACEQSKSSWGVSHFRYFSDVAKAYVNSTIVLPLTDAQRASRELQLRICNFLSYDFQSHPANA